MEKSDSLHVDETAGGLHHVRPEDQDDAAAFVGFQAHPVDPSVAQRARRKIDGFFLPTLLLGYGLVYYDKASASTIIFCVCRPRDTDRDRECVGNPWECGPLWNG